MIATRSRRGPALAPSRGSGGMLPREILKIGLRRYAFFTILGYNFRKIRERICKVICTYYLPKYLKSLGRSGRSKKKMFNMKKIMHPTVDPATFFLDVYARMSSPLLQNPIVCPCGHWQAQQGILAPLRHRAAVVWFDESQGRFFTFFFFFFLLFSFIILGRHGGGGGGRPRAPPPLDPPLISHLKIQKISREGPRPDPCFVLDASKISPRKITGP